MIKLTFKQYMEKLEDNKLIQRPTEHVYEGVTLFIFFFKSRENWDYYTKITKEEITGFSTLEDFKLNYCHHCLPVAESPVLLWEDYLDEDQDEYIINSKKKIDLDGADIVDKAETYQEFLEKTFEGFRAKVLSHINKLELSKMNKTFGEFVSNLFNSVNTAVFATQVKKYLKADLVGGMVEAENELGIKLKFDEDYNNKLKQLYSQQLDGYTINGKKWFGIKGVTKEIQADIIRTVQDGINSNKTKDEIKDDINSRFDNISEHRANLIARTETNRIVNEGLLVGYKQTGIEGGKVVKVISDDRTSEICMRMKSKYADTPIGLDEYFIDDETGKAFKAPPFHPQCRSRIAFRPK